ncbi:RHS repeat-associated core domain-containing protein [Pseudomonas sp. dw_358]|uniref:RHS repeat domain-containing protein n=1 Tax=Pseudomonas sp. dw_358 TaxID=2720083 RepID=UPI001BD22757|nr:RHS repeat-associated core domain-containing protein [Pseudomonas sp. dw_358]
MTSWDSSTRHLQLSSGERFKGEIVAETMRFADARLPAVDVTVKRQEMWVRHDDGSCERLAPLAGLTRLWVVTALVGADGSALQFEWRALGNAAMLQGIKDDSGRSVLQFTYDPGKIQPTQVSFQPGTTAAAQVFFYRTGGWLRRVTVEGLTEDGWRFEYQVGAPSGLLLLTKCTQPTGSAETVTYDEAAGLIMPAGAPFARMPVVRNSVKSMSDGTAWQRLRYDYELHGVNNVYGWPAVRQWRNQEDSLFNLTGAADFLYGSIETLMDGAGKTLSTVSRAFNRFHLLTRERTVKGLALQETTTDYYDNPARPVAEQVPYFQFPRTVTRLKAHLPADVALTALTDLNTLAGLRQRVSQEATRYDDRGNVVWSSDELGVVEEREYFPVEGDPQNCPADPLGRITRLKALTVTPPAGTQGPVKQTRYRYTAVSVRQGAPEFVLPTFIQCSEESLYVLGNDQSARLLTRTAQTFIDDPLSPHHGRLSEEHLFAGQEDDDPATALIRRLYTYEVAQTASARNVAHQVLKETVTVQGRGGSRSVTDSAQDLYSGLIVTRHSDNQVDIAYEHDVLGRVVEEVACPNTPYEARVSWTHAVSAAQSRRSRTGATGRTETVWLDCLGREVRREKQDDDGQVYTAWTGEYDVLGQLASVTEYDPGNEDAAPLSLTVVRTHDDWGNVLSQTTPDGVTQHTLVDPVALTVTAWQTYAQGMQGPRTVTTQGLDGQPLQEELFSPQGTLHSSSSWTYDGLGRCILHVDALNQETHQQWDAYDRLIASTLPDGARVGRTYPQAQETGLATHVTLAHPSLGPQEVVLGERRYDDLSRLVWEKVGSLTSTWAYHAGEMQAHTHTLPNGTEVKSEWIPELSDALASMHAPGVSITNRFDPITGLLRETRGTHGRKEQIWSAAKTLKQADYAWDGDSPRTQHQTLTPAGRVTRRTDADGVEQVYTYDALGRLSTQQDTDVRIALTYDDLSRVKSQDSRSLDSSRQMTVTFHYDAFGRPSRRETLSKVAGQQHSEEQTCQWHANGKLSRQVLSRDLQVIRDETYEYDVRGRLSRHRVQGSALPEDAYGRHYIEQRFEYDALDNIRRLETVLAEGGESNISLFEYDLSNPARLIKLSHSRGDYPAAVMLDYDAMGNLKRDERGNALHYDSMGRFERVALASGERRWYYGPSGAIIKTEDERGSHWRYHLDGQLTCELNAEQQTRWVRAGNVPVAQSRLAASIRRVCLLGTDAQGSINSEAGDTLNSLVYGAYGHSSGEALSRLGYTGALREPEIGWYFLGDYRIYNPVLMRFHSADSLSPFDEGGLNGYAYCGGDPVNRVDPSGHAWWSWALAGIGLVLGVVAAVVSAGALSGVAVAMTAGFISKVTTAVVAVTAVAVDATAIGLQIAGEEKAASVLGWVGLGLGVASIAMAGPQMAKQAAAKWNKFVGKGLNSGGEFRLEASQAVRRVSQGSTQSAAQRITDTWLGDGVSLLQVTEDMASIKPMSLTPSQVGKGLSLHDLPVQSKMESVARLEAWVDATGPASPNPRHMDVDFLDAGVDFRARHGVPDPSAARQRELDLSRLRSRDPWNSDFGYRNFNRGGGRLLTMDETAEFRALYRNNTAHLRM